MPSFKTVGDAIDQVARNVSLVNGRGMLPYSEDLLHSYIVAAYEFVSEEMEWDHLTIRHQRTLDGVNGYITQGITEVTDWKEIMRIYHGSSMTPLPKVTNYSNPLVSTTLIGYRGLSILEDPGPTTYRLVQFFPKILTGDVLFVSKITLDLSNKETVLPIDFWLYVFYASWMFALDDGTNPGQIAKYEKLYAKRLDQIKVMASSRPISLDPYAAIPDIWFEGDDPYWISSQ